VKVIPFGANLASSIDRTTVASLVEGRLAAPWRFLFVGVDWERKGADLVLATVAELNRRGHPSELVIVGCNPPARVEPLPAFVKVEGFINKRTEAGRRKMADLYRSTTFFFMPSRAEAYGIVFCEASAHGVPSLTTDTGGIPTIIQDGYNGRLFPIDASIEDYVSAILAVVRPETYRQLCENAVTSYEQNLNWEVGGRRAMSLIREALALRQPTEPPAEFRETAEVATSSP
jgi:glycosyltransferase involved in cell wall biosynthesis